MDSHWHSIHTELIMKAIEGIFESRLHEQRHFRRTYSSEQNIVLQTMQIENSKIRDEEIEYNFEFPWTLTLGFSLGCTQIEQWKFIFSILYE